MTAQPPPEEERCAFVFVEGRFKGEPCQIGPLDHKYLTGANAHAFLSARDATSKAVLAGQASNPTLEGSAPQGGFPTADHSPSRAPCPACAVLERAYVRGGGTPKPEGTGCPTNRNPIAKILHDAIAERDAEIGMWKTLAEDMAPWVNLFEKRQTASSVEAVKASLCLTRLEALLARRKEGGT